MEQEGEKRFSPLEAVPELDWEQTEEDAAPDPLDRPDLYVEEDELSEPVWTQPDMPTEPCPCCGADIPQNPSPGYICPMCWWEIDYFAADEDEPSEQNRGLSLAEARLNFRVFGICDPWLNRREEE